MSLKRSFRRTRFLASGLLTLAAEGRRDRGGGHDAYFAGLSAALKRAGIAQPTLVIDRARLDANIAAVRETLATTHLAPRIVTKSLPAPALLEAVMTGCATMRLMVFNGVMLDEMVRLHPASDVLTGRPLPAVQTLAFVRRHAGYSALAAHPQWLVDSPARLAQYAAIARTHNTRMRINLELDVGLHRGGLADGRAVAELIDLALAEPLIEVTGLMGYDAHVPAVADPRAEMARVQSRYAAARAVLLDKLGGDPARFTFNVAGSPTYGMHLNNAAASEVAIGSAFVKPLNFEHRALARLAPAAFIVQPVLKAMDQALIPEMERWAGLINWLNPNSRRGFFAYGGYGDAEAVSPPGLSFSLLYGGHSMLTGSDRIALHQDDFIFFRPRESEGVLLQFGDIAVFDGEEIAGFWPTFPMAA